MAEHPTAPAAAPTQPLPRPPPDDQLVLPALTRDESEPGWGDRAEEVDDDERLLRERPPHHEG